MHDERRLLWPSPHFRILMVVVTLSILPTSTNAQQGWNGAIQSGSTTSPSYAFVDATPYANDSRCTSACDLCKVISLVLTDYNYSNSNGVLVDARGITALNCSQNQINPWSFTDSQQNSAFSNVVLLPSGTITIYNNWVLPNNTHLIGEGPNLTTIAASSTLSGDMIDMGSETAGPAPYCFTNNQDCPGIVIEDLGLQGNGSVNGIVNCCAQELSRVNDVFISNVATGLAVTDKYAENSGPYTNITMSNVNVCVSIETGSNGAPITRGVHGLTCAVNNTTSPAILIDSPNNSLEEISISVQGTSSQDGILIGSQAPAEGNVLLNIGGTGLKNVIHISNNPNTPSQASNCPNSTNLHVCDVTILGVTRSGGNTSIQDDLVSTSQGIADANVAMYVVGEAVQAGSPASNIGYSRFTTSAAVPTWLVGSVPPPTTGSCAVGDLYSCTSSSACTSGTIFECIAASNPWLKIQ
jgi:hypothetical protein